MNASEFVGVFILRKNCKAC